MITGCTVLKSDKIVKNSATIIPKITNNS